MVGLPRLAPVLIHFAFDTRDRQIQDASLDILSIADIAEGVLQDLLVFEVAGRYRYRGTAPMVASSAAMRKNE